ncbi:MAG: hypothetical protein MHMPM18_003970, partial [Marteilia pararefringens]
QLQSIYSRILFLNCNALKNCRRFFRFFRFFHPTKIAPPAHLRSYRAFARQLRNRLRSIERMVTATQASRAKCGSDSSSTSPQAAASDSQTLQQQQKQQQLKFDVLSSRPHPSLACLPCLPFFTLNVLICDLVNHMPWN